jgi:hypothetical protein
VHQWLDWQTRDFWENYAFCIPNQTTISRKSQTNPMFAIKWFDFQDNFQKNNHYG